MMFEICVGVTIFKSIEASIKLFNLCMISFNFHETRIDFGWWWQPYMYRTNILFLWKWFFQHLFSCISKEKSFKMWNNINYLDTCFQFVLYVNLILANITFLAYTFIRWLCSLSFLYWQSKKHFRLIYSIENKEIGHNLIFHDKIWQVS